MGRALAVLGLMGIWGVFTLARNGAIPGVKLSLVAALGLTGLLALIVLLVFLFRKLKAAAAARQLDKTLNAQADAQEKNARPDQQPQVQEMRAEFAKAIGSLKSSKLGRSGADALNALPWYVIIGPPGAGKSTALRSSGLKFPYLGKKGGVRGVGGTRNCDWWLTHEGVLLDTAGRYMTEEDDQDEWMSFLDAVAKARPKRPINGLIVAVSAPELLGLDEQGAAGLGQQLRERVDEITGRLQVLTPVYLLVTKCDLLAGFVESFGSLPKSERGQVWGFTLPVGGPAHPDGPGQLVRERMDELTTVLEERSLTLLPQERRPEARERIFQFPRQFEALRTNLAEVAQALFSENPYQDTPLLRGAYFTSGTQEGRPIDKVMAAMAEAFGIRASQVNIDAPVTDARSYFLGDLFKDVLFKDSKLTVRSSKGLQKQKKQRYAYAGAAVGLSLLLVLLPLLSFLGMRGQAKQLASEVKAVAAVTSLDDRLTRLEAVRADVEELYGQVNSTASSVSSLGMDRRKELLEAVMPVYGFWVRELVVKPVLTTLDAPALAELPDPGGTPLPPGKLDEEQTYERLKRHLFLSLEPKDPPATRPELFASGLKSLGKPLAATFKDSSSVTASQEALEKHLALLFELWPRFHAQWRFDRREGLKRRGQAALAGMNRTGRLLDLQLRKWVGDKDGVTLGSLVQDDSALETDQVVRAAFTQDVWEEHAKAALDKPPNDDEAWILGAKAATTAQLQEALKRQYYLQYIQEWKQFLLSIELRQVSDPNDVRRRLEALTDAQSPLKSVFRKLAENVMLARPSTGTHAPDERTVAAAFAPLAAVAPAALDGLPDLLKSKGGLGGKEKVDLAMYEGRLKDLLGAVKGATEPAAAAGVARSMRAAAADLTSVILSQRKGELYESVLTQLWVKPIEKMANALDARTRQSLNLKWCSSVYSLHQQELRGRYPFVRAGPDADLAALVELYNGKDGKLVAFYKENLESKVDTDGRDYKRIGGELVRDELLGYLSRARTLAEAVFPSDAPQPSVDFKVQLHVPPVPGVLSVNLVLDGQELLQDTGPQEAPRQFRWPGEEKAPKAAYLVIARKGAPPGRVDCVKCKGPWGLFHLLDEAKVTPTGPRSFSARWISTIGVEVTADFSWARSVSPFYGREGGRPNFLGVFRDADPPPTIVAGVEGCR